MSTISCNDFLNHLDSWIEGEQDEAARSHIRNCESCRALTDDFSAMHRTARTFELEELAPPEHVWTALRSQLEQDGLIRTPRQGWAAELSGWLENIRELTRGPACKEG